MYNMSYMIRVVLQVLQLFQVLHLIQKMRLKYTLYKKMNEVFKFIT